MTIVVVVTASGLPTARRIADTLDAPLHGRPEGADTTVEDLGVHLRDRFRQGSPIVFVGALGALVRLLASAIGDKAEDPPVVVVAEDGSAVIPLLGGHHGGNDLARRIGAVRVRRSAFGVARAIRGRDGQLSAAIRPRLATYQSQEEALDVGVGEAIRADGGSGDGHEGHRE